MSEPSAAASPSAADERASPYAWYALSVLVLVYILNFVDRQIISILANDIKRDLSMTDADLGFLYGTAFGVFYALFGIPLGRLADSWHRIRLMTLGLVLWSGMTAVSGFAQSTAALGLARMGVGIGEASASPAAYSLISDWFPKRMRATALAVYSSGLYLGVGVSLFIGGAIVGRWNSAFPDGGPLGLVGWQAAFLAVGLPGLLVAGLVATLHEPKRGAREAHPAAQAERPLRAFLDELLTVIPPLTLIAAARRGGSALAINLAAAAGIAAAAFALIAATGGVLQWAAVGIGVYAVFSWASELRRRDPPTFALIWGNPAFLYTILGYGMVSFSAYAVSFWAAPYAERVLGQPKEILGLAIGSAQAIGGFLGVIIGGRVADRLRQRHPAGRLWVMMFGVLAPALPLAAAFTTSDATLFYALCFVMALFSSSALGAAAATTQDLVLPRMRGTATATFFLATTLVGLALGPYTAGYVSTLTGSLSIGILSVLVAAPIGLFCLIQAMRLVPAAEAGAAARAQAAGEPRGND